MLIRGLGIANGLKLCYAKDVMKRSIDLNSVFFHGLESIHNIQREQRALEKLECIFQCGTNCEIKKQLSLIQSARWVGFHNSIGELLCKYGYDDIPIISSRDGFEIENVQEVIDEMGL